MNDIATTTPDATGTPAAFDRSHSSHEVGARDVSAIARDHEASRCPLVACKNFSLADKDGDPPARTRNMDPRDGCHMSHQEIATALGITQQAVSKIEKRALAKARAALEAAGLSRADAGDEAWIIPAQGMRP